MNRWERPSGKIPVDSREVTPFVRQYDILDNKWGALLCQKGYQTNDTHQNLKSW